MKTKKIAKLKARIYRKLEKCDERIPGHLSVQYAIEEAVDLRDIHDNLAQLVHDAVNALAVVKGEMGK